MNSMADLRRKYPWSKVKNVIAYPTHERLEKISHKDLARCYTALLDDMVKLNHQITMIRDRRDIKVEDYGKFTDGKK